jgi:uncharacterized membrane protein YedE/YeeE
MKNIRLLIIGVAFGFVLSKGELISFYRFYEMFRFEGFHMFGIIGTAVMTSLIFNQWMKRSKMNDIDGKPINIPKFYVGWKQYLIGGTIFGLGWALTGSCPGPLYIQIGYGSTVMIIAVISALTGSFLYGVLKSKLPH